MRLCVLFFATLCSALHAGLDTIKIQTIEGKIHEISLDLALFSTTLRNNLGQPEELLTGNCNDDPLPLILSAAEFDCAQEMLVVLSHIFYLCAKSDEKNKEPAEIKKDIINFIENSTEEECNDVATMFGCSLRFIKFNEEQWAHLIAADKVLEISFFSKCMIRAVLKRIVVTEEESRQKPQIKRSLSAQNLLKLCSQLEEKYHPFLFDVVRDKLQVKDTFSWETLITPIPSPL